MAGNCQLWSWQMAYLNTQQLGIENCRNLQHKKGHVPTPVKKKKRCGWTVAQVPLRVPETYPFLAVPAWPRLIIRVTLLITKMNWKQWLWEVILLYNNSIMAMPGSLASGNNPNLQYLLSGASIFSFVCIQSSLSALQHSASFFYNPWQRNNGG